MICNNIFPSSDFLWYLKGLCGHPLSVAKPKLTVIYGKERQMNTKNQALKAQADSVLLEATFHEHFNPPLAPETEASALSAFRNYLPRGNNLSRGLSSPLNPEKLQLVGDHSCFLLSKHDGVIMAFPPTQFELCSAEAESRQREMAVSLDAQSHATCPPSSHFIVIYHLFSL